MKNTRRDFLKGAGIIGGLAGAFIGSKIIINEKEKVNKQAVAEIERVSPPVLQITTKYGELDTSPPPQYVFTLGPRFKPGTETLKDVKFLPGPDGELYIRTNGEWKKVITT